MLRQYYSDVCKSHPKYSDSIVSQLKKNSQPFEMNDI